MCPILGADGGCAGVLAWPEACVRDGRKIRLAGEPVLPAAIAAVPSNGPVASSTSSLSSPGSGGDAFQQALSTADTAAAGQATGVAGESGRTEAGDGTAQSATAQQAAAQQATAQQATAQQLTGQQVTAQQVTAQLAATQQAAAAAVPASAHAGASADAAAGSTDGGGKVARGGKSVRTGDSGAAATVADPIPVALAVTEAAGGTSADSQGEAGGEAGAKADAKAGRKAGAGAAEAGAGEAGAFGAGAIEAGALDGTRQSSGGPDGAVPARDAPVAAAAFASIAAEPATKGAQHAVALPAGQPVASSAAAAATDGGLFAASLLTEPAVATPAVSAPVAAAATPQAAFEPPAAQVAPALLTLGQAADGTRQMTLRLHPAELGAVQVQIGQTETGAARVEITADKADTLQALIRDQPQLHRALDDAGVPAAGRVITFHAAPVESTANGGSSSWTGNQGGSFTASGSGGHGGGKNGYSDSGSASGSGSGSGSGSAGDTGGRRPGRLPPEKPDAAGGVVTYRIGINIIA
jgi:flagellar hook-length control protein FliK